MAIIAYVVAALLLIIEAQSTAACEANTFLCSDCTTLVACFGGTELSLPCTSGQICGNNGENEKIDACFESTDDKNKNKTDCACDDAATAPSYKADPYNPAAYLACLPGKAAPLPLTCPEGEVFTEGQNPPCGATTTLSPDAIPEPFVCPAGGFFVDTAECSKYWACASESDPKPTELKCDPDTNVFDEATLTCVDPCEEKDICADAGTDFMGGVADPTQCSVFHICVAEKAVGQPVSCPCGQVFKGTACEAGTCDINKCSICPTASTVASNCADTTTPAASSSPTSSSASATGSSPMSDSSPTSTGSSPMSDSTPTSTGSSSVSDTATTGTGSTPMSDSTTTASSSSLMSDSSSSQSTTSVNPSDTTTGSVSTTVGIPDCASATEAGYFPNPDSCKMFYSCESDGAGGYVLKDYTCAGSLVFDPANQYCNLANLVPGC